MTGHDLLKTICRSTDISSQTLEKELNRLLDKNGVSAENLTLDQLREVLADYLQDVLLEAKKQTA